MQEEITSKLFSPSDVITLLRSVLSVTSTIYPDAYETDKRLFDIIRPKLKAGRRKVTYHGESFNISVREMLALIDMKYGFKKWFDEFSSKFNVDEGIDKNYKRLVSEYSSVEILMYYNIFQNLSNITVTIISGEDMRPQRVRNTTVMKLPDTVIDTIEIVLRDFYTQDVVDIINQFCIDNGSFRNDGMSRTFTTICDNMHDFHNVLKSIGEWGDNEDFVKVLLTPLLFTEIGEIANTAVIVTTDYPDL